jgi:protein-S-isoprenylcysteine O-methyltransferase Ste14
MDVRQFLFKYRGFTPVPLLLGVLIIAQPTLYSFLGGIMVMLMGETIRLWGVSYAGGATRTRKVGANRLVTSGPFARVRNPLYIGNILLYIGTALIANVWLPWLIGLVLLYFGTQYYFIVKLEEEKLKQLFGLEYLEYQGKVPKFLPRLHPIESKNPVFPDFLAALRSEKSTFISFITILVLFLAKLYFTNL